VKKLGLEGAAQLGFDSSELFSNEDLDDVGDETIDGREQAAKRYRYFNNKKVQHA
jgi:hypothetical protein